MKFLEESRSRSELPDRSEDERIVEFNQGRSAFYDDEDGYILRSTYDNCLQGLLKNPPSEPYTDANLQKGCFALVSGLGVTILRERPTDSSVKGSVLTFPVPPYCVLRRCFYQRGDTRITGYHVPGGTAYNPGGPMYYEVLQELDDDKITEVKDDGTLEWDEGGLATRVVTSVIGGDSKLFKSIKWNKVKVNWFDVPGSCAAPPPSATMC